MSLASEQAVAAQQASATNGYYNVHAGPFNLRFQGEMGLELNDNVAYAHTDKDADLGFRPNLNVKGYWQATELNTLALSVGIGYVAYIHDPKRSYVNISSDSGLAFNAYSGDFVFNLHDRVSALDYAIQDASVSDILIRLENTAGLGVTWDLYKLVLNMGFDYDTFNSLSGNYQYSDNASELISGKAAVLISSASQLGLEAGGGFTSYSQQVLEGSAHFSAGPFYQARFTPNLSGQVSAGYLQYKFDHGGDLTNLSEFSGYYASASLNHRLNDYFSQYLSAGRKTQLGIIAELSEEDFVFYQLTWRFNQSLFVAGRFSFAHGNTDGSIQSLGYVNEKYDRYGPGLTFGWHISEKLLARASYDYLNKESDVSFYNYVQNRLLLDFTYDF